MKYRTKLSLAFVSIAIASTLLAIIILSTEAEKLIYHQLGHEIQSIAATAAKLLDPNQIQQLKSTDQQDSPLYREIKNRLYELRKANRRTDTYLDDFYLIYADPNSLSKLVNIMSTSSSKIQIGSTYLETDKEEILNHLKEYYVNPNFITDELGVWLSAYAPILDNQGNYIATLGADISAKGVTEKLQKLLHYGLWAFCASTLLALIIAFILAKKVTTSLHSLCDSVEEIGKGNLSVKADLDTEDEFGELADAINDMTKGLEERERLKMSFARYVSQHILDKILKSESSLKLEGERRKITVLFSDIRQFTRLAEHYPAEDVVHLLNQYFERMIEVIFSHNGTLDKFIGDGIMAEFGAPLDDLSQEKNAVAAAIEMQKQLKILSEKWQKEGKPNVEMGIGIHTGEAIVGNIGSERRTEYTAIGDTVNVAARLEQATKMLKVPILISETTFLAAKDHYEYKDLGSMALPGRREPIRVYSVIPKI